MMRPHDTTASRRSTDRGQTGIDFLIGMGVFLFTVAFVVGVVPGILAPYHEPADPPVVADRVADTLVHDSLAADAPGVLDDGCTLAFFGVGADAGCAFAGDGPAADWLTVPPDYRLNVTVERDVDGDGAREQLCADGGAVASCAPGDSRLALGDAAPSGGDSVATALRVVRFDEVDAVVVVRLW